MLLPRVSLTLLLCIASACSVHRQESGALFDTLKGRGPVLIEPANQGVASTRFFHDMWVSSSSIKHLVTQRGTPEAISTEREFLKPNRMKLFYPSQGQVYVLDQLDGEWLVSGSEPMVTNEFDQVTRQKTNLINPGVQAVPVLHTAVPTNPQPPVARIDPEEFRGQLKPPAAAVVARLSRRADDAYIHTVSFPGEDFVVLADWYTDSPRNAERLAITNNRGLHRSLRIGDQIVIPRSLMANPEPLPEAMVP